MSRPSSPRWFRRLPPARIGRDRPTLHGAVLFLLVGTGYAVGYQLASNWFSAEDQGASFFPPAGITLAALVLVERRRWPIVLAAAAIAELSLDLSNGTSLAASLGYVLANVVEPLVGALLLTTLVPWVDLRRPHDLAAFIGSAVMVAPIVGALIAATTFVYVDDHSGWGRFAFEWWSGDGLAVLVVGGAILSLRSLPRLTATRAVEGAVIAAFAIAGTWAVFDLGRFELIYVPAALLVVLAFRIGTTGVAITSALVAFVAAGATAEASEFWTSIDVSAANRVLYLQLALAVITAAVLALAAEISERERIAVALARAESERSAALDRAQLVDSEQRARIHAESIGRSAALLAGATTVTDVGQAAVSVMSEWGAGQALFYVVDGDLLRLEASIGVEDGRRDECASLPITLDTPPAEAARRGHPVVTRETGGLDRLGPAIAAGVRGRARTLAAFPVLAGGGVRGVLAGRMDEPRGLSDDRHQLLLTLADQVAVAFERAQFQAEAQAAAQDDALLARLGVALERATGMEDRAGALVHALTQDRAWAAFVHALDDDGDPELLTLSSSVPGFADVDEPGLARLADAALSADGLARAELGGLVLLAVPLRARDRVIGVLTIGTPLAGGARLTPVLALRVATRAALALDNALLYEQERDVSHSLQIGLLGGDLAHTPYTAVASAYRPGTSTLEVGGDWYDAFTLPDGRLALLVGDVVGHGLEAAVAMGQLRGAVRALAPLGSPRQVLEGLDLFVEQLPPAEMATVAYAVLDPRDGCLTYACAGHPPPLVAPAEGAPRLLWDGRSAPLGSSLGSARVEAVDHLGLGDTIVLYTDGLVERRTEGISAGLDTLLEITGRSSAGRPSNLVDRILDGLLGERPSDDDVCVLSVHHLGSGTRFVHSFPAAPGEVAWARQALARWLSAVGLDQEGCHDVVLAASEAAANSAEHAYGFDGSGITRLEATVAAGRLELQIRDGGAWRDRQPGGDRGRGYTIIRALMPDVTVDRREDGTTVQMSRPLQQEVPVA